MAPRITWFGPALLLVASRRRFAAARSCLCALLIGACGEPPPQREWTPADHGQPENADPDRTPKEDAQPVTSAESLARAAAALWNASCASCHGREGRGDGAARPPGAQLPDFSSAQWQSTRSDEQLAQVIRDGRGTMPGFGKQLNANGIEVLVDQVRRFVAAEPAPTEQPAAEPPR
jgi:mono/diheme cytochrome c family protein